MTTASGGYEAVRNPQPAAYTPRRRCAYDRVYNCPNFAVPGMRHHLGWVVCADHETPEEAMQAHDLIGDLTDAERLELDRLRKFVRRLAYVRSHMAAGDQAIMDALTDDRYTDVLAALDGV